MKLRSSPSRNTPRRHLIGKNFMSLFILVFYSYKNYFQLFRETDNTNIHIFVHSSTLRSTPEEVANPLMACLQRPGGLPLLLTLWSTSTRNGIA